MFKKSRYRYIFAAAVIIVVIILIAVSGKLIFTSKNPYQSIRTKMFNTLVPEVKDENDVDYISRLKELDAKAKELYDTMEKSETKESMWADTVFDNESNLTVRSEVITTEYARLKKLATVYNIKDSVHYKNTDIKNAVIDGLEWLYAHSYNNETEQVGNWWDYCIGIPLALNDTVILMYDDIAAENRNKYAEAVLTQVPVVDMTGANTAWKCMSVVGAAAISENEQRLSEATTAVQQVLPYIPSESAGGGSLIAEGFYEDGSFIQHGSIPSTASYGQVCLKNMASVVNLTKGTQWEIPGVDVIYDWIIDSFEPVIYKGRFTDLLRGRTVAMSTTNDRIGWANCITTLSQAALSAPDDKKTHIEEFIKTALSEDTDNYYYSNVASLADLILAKNIQNDKKINLADTNKGIKVFYNMDRVMQKNADYAFALSMFSDRTYNYEAINAENLKGWNHSNGMTMIYNGDLNSYTDNYWATVDSYRIPGVTSVYGDESNHYQYSNESQVGGTTISGQYGVAGMALGTNWNSLTGEKSWFMFDNEVVCIGSGITDDSGLEIETVAENRKVYEGFGYDSDTENVEKAELGDISFDKWVLLKPGVDNANLGYWFPNGGAKGIYEKKSGSWIDVALTNNTDKEKETKTNLFALLMFNHKKSPSNAAYSYVILPGRTAEEMSSYTQTPDIDIISKSTDVHCVRENNLNITAANFWNEKGAAAGGISADTSCSVMLRKLESGDCEISISDPAQKDKKITKIRGEYGGLNNEIKIEGDSRVILTLDEAYNNGLTEESDRVTLTSEDGKTVISVDLTGTFGDTVTFKLKK